MITILWVTFFVMMTGFRMWDMHRLEAIGLRYTELAAHSEEELWHKDAEEIDWERWSDMSLIGFHESYSDRENRLVTVFEEKTAEGLFYVKNLECSAYIDSDLVRIRYKGIWKCPMQSWLFMNSGNEFDFVLEQKVSEPEEFVRMLHGLSRGFL